MAIRQAVCILLVTVQTVGWAEQPSEYAQSQSLAPDQRLGFTPKALTGTKGDPRGYFFLHDSTGPIAGAYLTHI